MAVAFDATASGSKVTLTAGEVEPGLSITHTTVSAVNGVVFIFITWINASGLASDTDNIGIISCTYNGVAATHINDYSIGSGYTLSVYSANSLVGAKSFSVLWDDLDVPGSSIVLTAQGVTMSVTGANQATPVAQTVNATGSTSPITKAIVTASVNNLVIDNAVGNRAASTLALTVGGGQTQKFNAAVGTSPTRAVVGVSIKQATGGSDTMSWTESTNRAWGTRLFEIAAGSAANLITRSRTGYGL